MRAPTQATQDMTETTNGLERGVERDAAHRVVDKIEAATVGIIGDIIFDRQRAIVDRGRSLSFDEIRLFGGARRENLGAESARDLNGDVADPSGALDQN